MVGLAADLAEKLDELFGAQLSIDEAEAVGLELVREGEAVEVGQVNLVANLEVSKGVGPEVEDDLLPRVVEELELHLQGLLQLLAEGLPELRADARL